MEIVQCLVAIFISKIYMILDFYIWVSILFLSKQRDHKEFFLEFRERREMKNKRKAHEIVTCDKAFYQISTDAFEKLTLNSIDEEQKADY